jgi:replicative superfamily II helicase
LTVLFIKDTFEKLHTDDDLDLESMINIVLRANAIEGGEKAPLSNQETIAEAMMEWINEDGEEEILCSKAVAPGDLYDLTGELSRMAKAGSHIAALLGLTRLSNSFSITSKRIRYGVREDLLSLMELSIPSVGRKLARKLYDLGYTNADEFIRATPDELAEIVHLPENTVAIIKEYVEKVATNK